MTTADPNKISGLRSTIFATTLPKVILTEFDAGTTQIPNHNVRITIPSSSTRPYHELKWHLIRIEPNRGWACAWWKVLHEHWYKFIKVVEVHSKQLVGHRNSWMRHCPVQSAMLVAAVLLCVIEPYRYQWVGALILRRDVANGMVNLVRMFNFSINGMTIRVH